MGGCAGGKTKYRRICDGGFRRGSVRSLDPYFQKQESLAVATRMDAMKPSDLACVVIDTTVIVRARIKIGLQNFAYNARWLATPQRTSSLASFNMAGRLVDTWSSHRGAIQRPFRSAIVISLSRTSAEPCAPLPEWTGLQCRSRPAISHTTMSST
jgi:hypothetical protein